MLCNDEAIIDPMAMNIDKENRDASDCKVVKDGLHVLHRYVKTEIRML